MYDSTPPIQEALLSDVTAKDVYGLGNTPETAITNEMAKREGFPARTVDGELVLIVQKQARAEGGTLLLDESGKSWISRGDGALLPTDGNGQLAAEYVDEPLPTNEATSDGEFNDGRVADGRSPEREAA